MALLELNFNEFDDFEKSTNEYTNSENSDLFENLSRGEQSQMNALSSEDSRKAQMNKNKRFVW